MTYADAHCHLQDPRLAPHLPEILRLARESGVFHVHTNAAREADWPATAALEAPQRPDAPAIRVSFGIHPWHAGDAAPGWPDRLRALLLAHPRAGVGESGLDGSLPGSIAPAQWTAFRAQWDLSVNLRRPISLHGRGAWTPLLGFILSQPPHPAGVLLHAYGGPTDVLPALAEKNAYISLGGSITRPGNQRARRILAAVPPGRFLLETDAPDIPPTLPLGTPPAFFDAARRPLSHPAQIPYLSSFLPPHLLPSLLPTFLSLFP
jgi:TatD DNase family protein